MGKRNAVRMIKLTKVTGVGLAEIYVNPGHISIIEEATSGVDGSEITMQSGKFLAVAERLDVVIGLLQEARNEDPHDDDR